MHGLTLLLPDFGMILLGILLRKTLLKDGAFWFGLERLVYFVLFPVLLFYAIVRTHIDWQGAAPLFLSGLAAVLSGLCVGLAGQWFFPRPPMVFASRVQCAFRFNSYIGLAVAESAFGKPGMAAMGIMLGAMVPIVNSSAVWLMARQQQANIVRELLRNPLIVATVGGLIANTLGFSVPDLLRPALVRLSDASVTLGLLCVGAALQFSAISGEVGISLWISGTKLVVMPAVAWWVGSYLGLSGLYFGIAVLFAALPTASSAYILASRMGGDGPGVAWLISLSTLTALLTLSVWLGLLPM